LTDPSIPPVGRTCGRARTGHQTRCPRRPRHCGRGRGRRVSRRQGWVDAGRGVTPRSEEPTAVTAGSTGIGGVASTPDGTVPLSPASVDRPDGPVFGDVRLPAPAGPRARDCHRVRRRVRAGLRPRASRPAGGDRAVRPRQYPRRSRRVSGTLLRRHGTGPVPAGPARRVGAALREPNHGRRGISSVHHCCVTLFNPPTPTQTPVPAREYNGGYLVSERALVRDERPSALTYRFSPWDGFDPQEGGEVIRCWLGDGSGDGDTAEPEQEPESGTEPGRGPGRS
jgi:hypothetical protein